MNDSTLTAIPPATAGLFARSEPVELVGAIHENGRIFAVLKRGRFRRMVDATYRDLASPTEVHRLWRDAVASAQRRQRIRRGRVA